LTLLSIIILSTIILGKEHSHSQHWSCAKFAAQGTTQRLWDRGEAQAPPFRCGQAQSAKPITAIGPLDTAGAAVLASIVRRQRTSALNPAKDVSEYVAPPVLAIVAASSRRKTWRHLAA